MIAPYERSLRTQSDPLIFSHPDSGRDVRGFPRPFQSAVPSVQEVRLLGAEIGVRGLYHRYGLSPFPKIFIEETGGGVSRPPSGCIKTMHHAATGAASKMQLRR